MGFKKHYLEYEDQHFSISATALKWMYEYLENERHWYSMRVAFKVDRFKERIVYFSIKITLKSAE